MLFLIVQPLDRSRKLEAFLTVLELKKQRKTILRSTGLSSIQAKYMVDTEFQVPPPFDPFAEEENRGAREYVHIRVQQRNGKKSVTTVEGLQKDVGFEKLLKGLKKEFCCNGNVVNDKALGKIIQLQGDQRKNVSQFLVNKGLAQKDQIKIHGY